MCEACMSAGRPTWSTSSLALRRTSTSAAMTWSLASRSFMKLQPRSWARLRIPPWDDSRGAAEELHQVSMGYGNYYTSYT